MNLDKATPELFTALCAAQGTIADAVKNSTNVDFGSEFADLGQVLREVRGAFAPNGLSVMQAPSYDGTLAHVTTVLGHNGGGMISFTSSCQPETGLPQDIGAATTYLRRYAAQSVAGIAQQDNDGRRAAPHTAQAIPADKPAAPMPKAKAESPSKQPEKAQDRAKEPEAAKAASARKERASTAGGLDGLSESKRKLLRAKAKAAGIKGSDAEIEAAILELFKRVDDSNFPEVLGSFVGGGK